MLQNSLYFMRDSQSKFEYTPVMRFYFFQVLYFVHVHKVLREDLTFRIFNLIVLHLPLLCWRLTFVFEFQRTFMWVIKHFYRFYRLHEKKKLYRHVPDSPGNKNLKSLVSNFLSKMVFFRLQTHFATIKKIFVHIFKHYVLTKSKEYDPKIWGTYA